MQLEMFRHGDGCPAYLVADAKTRRVAVVNPTLPLDAIEDWLRKYDYRARYVVLPDAQFASDLSGFAKQNSASVYILDSDSNSLSSRSNTQSGNRLCSGDVLQFGDVRIKVFRSSSSQTCLTIQVFDLTKSEREPSVVLERKIFEGQ